MWSPDHVLRDMDVDGLLIREQDLVENPEPRRLADEYREPTWPWHSWPPAVHARLA